MFINFQFPYHLKYSQISKEGEINRSDLEGILIPSGDRSKSIYASIPW